MKIEFNRMENPNKDLGDYIVANHRASSNELMDVYPDKSIGILGCSDARVEEDIIYITNNGNKPFVLALAGNVVKNSVEIPSGMENIIIMPHEHSQGIGCGASGLAGALEDNLTNVDNLSDALSFIGMNVHRNARDNAIVQSFELGRRVTNHYLTTISHATGEMLFYQKEQEKWVGPQAVLEFNQEDPILYRLARSNMEYAAGFNPVVDNFDMRKGQNPKMAIFTGIDATASDISPGEAYNGPNKIFEVKPGADNLTIGALGSLEYVWLHANDGGNSFQDTLTSALLMPRLHDGGINQQMEKVKMALLGNEALERYTSENVGGRLFLIGVNENNQMNEFYELNK